MSTHIRCRLDDWFRSVALWFYYEVRIIGRPMLDLMNRDPLRVWQDDGE